MIYMGPQRVWHNWVTKHSTCYLMITIAQWRECGCLSLFHKWENKGSENLCKKGFQNRIPKCGILCHLMLPLHDLKINMLTILMCVWMYTHMCMYAYVCKLRVRVKEIYCKDLAQAIVGAGKSLQGRPAGWKLQAAFLCYSLEVRFLLF